MRSEAQGHVVDEYPHAGAHERSGGCEHHEESERDRRANSERAGYAGVRGGVGVGLFDPEEVRQVGRQHREPAGVERGHQPGGEGERERYVDHGRRRSWIFASSCCAEISPL